MTLKAHFKWYLLALAVTLALLIYPLEWIGCYHVTFRNTPRFFSKYNAITGHVWIWQQNVEGGWKRLE